MWAAAGSPPVTESTDDSRMKSSGLFEIVSASRHA